MGEITEKRMRHYVGADADKDLIPADAKDPGDSFHANDTKKQYYWNGTDWKTGVGYEFVPRAVTALDFNTGNFTRDGAYHVDGLDLTGIVPVGTIAVHIELVIRATAANVFGGFRANATTKTYNRILPYTQVANITFSQEAFLYIDSNRLVDYIFDAQIDNIGVTIKGWMI